jgi:hypothetical protein
VLSSRALSTDGSALHNPIFSNLLLLPCVCSVCYALQNDGIAIINASGIIMMVNNVSWLGERQQQHRGTYMPHSSISGLQR